MSRPAVFLDRDGVLVEEIYYPESGEWEGPWRADDVRIIPGAAAAARALADSGFALVLISNQAAFAKGKTTLRDTWLAHEHFVSLLADEGVKLDAVFYAYGHPNGFVPHFTGPSLDRKPSPYNIFIAAAQLDLDLVRSWLVGDRETDVACAPQQASNRSWSRTNTPRSACRIPMRPFIVLQILSKLLAGL
jgi:HAD-superfamily hydrolase, subfamily IIIA